MCQGMCEVWLLRGIACAAPALCFALSGWGRVCDMPCLLAVTAPRCRAWCALGTLQVSGLGPSTLPGKSMRSHCGLLFSRG